MASISQWYNSQYSTWNRTRRLQTSPYLARTDTNTARTAAAMIRNADTDGQNNATTINMGSLNDSNGAKKKQDSLFGPNIGIVSSGPAWTDFDDKNSSVDKLTPEIVNNWVARSKEPTQPTTTLQALVNLKRPTLRLSPLNISPADDPDHVESHHHHGLEFEYDCDSAKCGIYVHVILSPDQQPTDSEGEKDKSSLSRVLVFETIVPGGFGKLLKLEEGATLELGRFENHPQQAASEDASPPEVQANTDPGAVTPENTPPSGNAARHDRRRRFTNFHFRRRSQNRSISGPALAVVDAESSTPHDKDKNNKENQENEGVKVTIKLVALDKEGEALCSRNEQITYLHVVRIGTAPPNSSEDIRPWVVKVVKREATIGPHTFHLHEIYGLSSQSSAPAPTIPAPPTLSVPAHAYPPTAPAPVDDEPSSECLLCLSSPREVVLLPCRHLVACKECAINMVEFGAGGTIVHNDSEPSATGATGQGEGEASTPVTAVVTPPANPRRKRKAKGWFCPVCRQPYTSLLRITSNPPSKEDKEVEEPTSPTVENDDAESATPRPGLVSSLRPGFLRNMSRARPTEPVPDLERGDFTPAMPSLPI